MTTLCTQHDSPIGPLLLVGRRDGDSLVLTGLYFPEDRRPGQPQPDWHEDRAAFAEVRRQLDEYFAGTRQAFDLPIELVEGSDFQRSVWTALATIPSGATITYGQLAERVGRPGAARAIGGAVGRNPIPIVLPCHRVIGADGSLTGFGGGLDAKRALLALERPGSSA